MAVTVERFQPEGMNVRMSDGRPSYSHVVTVSGSGKIVYIAGQLARDVDGNWIDDRFMINRAGIRSNLDQPALTGLRGITALLLATYHYFLPFLQSGSIPYRLFGRGYLYVDLFFVLSGYVLMLNYGKMFANGAPSATLKLFFWKRFARVYPLYFCVLVAMLVGYWSTYGDFTDHGGWMVIALPHPLLDIPLNVALMQSWGLTKGIVGQAWSVSTETMAYLVFPWLVILASNTSGLKGRPVCAQGWRGGCARNQ